MGPFGKWGYSAGLKNIYNYSRIKTVVVRKFPKMEQVTKRQEPNEITPTSLLEKA